MPRRSVRSRRRAMGGFLSFAIGALTIAALVLICAIAIPDRLLPGGTDAPEPPLQQGDAGDDAGDNYVDVNDLPDSRMVLVADSFSTQYLPENATPVPTLTPEPTASPTPEPTATVDPNDPYAALRPTALGENMLPIFSRANTSRKVIAITLDECNDVRLMKKFMKLASAFDARLTLFPTGENIMKTGMGAIMKTCLFDMGFEIENRGYSEMSRLYQYIDTMLNREIWMQSVALSYVLGVRYEPHFYRMYGGSGERDPRTHDYLKQQGYIGIAHWTVSCTGMDIEQIPSKLTPGGIYAFRSSEEDGLRMYALMQAAKKKGYKMVTLNTLFGYPANTYAKVKGSVLTETMPEYTYEYEYFNLFPGDVSWAVTMMQQRLTKLGYLPESSADGIFGENTAIGLRAFQTQSGLAASGVGDVSTLQKLYSANAKENSVPLTELFKDENPFEGAGELSLKEDVLVESESVESEAEEAEPEDFTQAELEEVADDAPEEETDGAGDAEDAEADDDGEIPFDDSEYAED